MVERVATILEETGVEAKYLGLEITESTNLNLKVIAEGVEKEEQLNFLQGKDCNDMQGFYFSKPLPPEELEKFIK